MINLILAENSNFKFVKVVFDSNSREYTYKTTLDVNVDDFCVVNVNNQFKIVKVAEVLSPDEYHESGAFEIKWIVSAFSTEYYKACINLEKDISKRLTTVTHKKKREAAMAELKSAVGEEAVTEVTKLVRL